MTTLDKVDPGWAWKPYVPDAKRPWDLRQAAHLMRRAGFGADWPTLQQAVKDGPQAAVDRLLRPPADVEAFNRTYDQLESDSIDVDATSTQTLRQWWLRRMLLSPHVLLEKMTLFWHSHFGVSGGRVGNERLVGRHIGLLRRHALGSFSELLGAICRDPAVLANAGASRNPRSRPNDYLARVVLEQYILGPGKCSEDDVREAARAFTGCSLLRGEYRFRDNEHDEGPKRLLGEQGPWREADVVRIALAQPEASRYLVRKLFAWLVSETGPAPEALIEPLAQAFGKDYQVGPLVETMLRSNLFFSPDAYRRRVKSPVEFAVGIARGLGDLVPTGPLGSQVGLLGQELCQPPTVRGWAGGTLWLNRFTMVARSNMAGAMLAGSGAFEGKLNPAETARRQGFSSPEAALRFLVDLFVQGDLPAELAARLAQAARAGGDPDGRLRRLTHAIVMLPEFQLA